MLQGSAAASSSAPNDQAEVEVAKKTTKRQRQKAKKDFKDMLGREPNEQEVMDYLKAGEAERARAPVLSGPPQPKRLMREVAYKGVPVPKATAPPIMPKSGTPSRTRSRQGDAPLDGTPIRTRSRREEVRSTLTTTSQRMPSPARTRRSAATPPSCGRNSSW